jgi:hypothetical protein
MFDLSGMPEIGQEGAESRRASSFLHRREAWYLREVLRDTADEH